MAENETVTDHSAPLRSRRRVVLLGATGSIGRQCCDVISRFPDRFDLVGVAAGTDAAGLADVVRRFDSPNS